MSINKLSLLIFLIALPAFFASSKTEFREVVRKDKIMHLASQINTIPHKPMGMVGVSISNAAESDPTEREQTLLVEITTSWYFETLYIEVPIQRGVRITSNPLPNLEQNVYPGEVIRYEVDVQIESDDPHLVISAFGFANNNKVGSIGNHQFLDLKVEENSKNIADIADQSDRVSRKPSSQVRRDVLRIDPTKTKISR